MSKLRSKWRDLKTRMNLGLGKVAKLTHFIPEKPRKFVAEKLIRLTDPNRMARSYWPPKHTGRIHGRKGINLFGFFRAENGLAQGAKSYAKALACSGIPHDLINTDFLSWLPQEDHRLDGRLKKKGKYRINLIHVNADQTDEAARNLPYRQFRNHYNIGVWLWELEKMPETWKGVLTGLDEIWVPSVFVGEAIRKATDKPVTVIPYGIETPKSGKNRQDFGLPGEKFLVLAMFDSNSYASRKNPKGAIEAFRKAFGNDSDTDAELVLKLSNRKEEEVRELETLLVEAGIRYHMISERYSREDMNALIACCDVFISLHRSEGFGLVMAEAMSLGTVTLATGWSANTEFMPDSCTCLVDYTLVSVGDKYPYTDETSRWAEPNTEQAAEKLRYLYEHPAERRRISREAAEYISREFNPETCAEKMRRRYEEINETLGARPRNNL